MKQTKFLLSVSWGAMLLASLFGVLAITAAPVAAAPSTTWNIAPADAERVPFNAADGICTIAEAVQAANAQGANVNDCGAASAGTNIIQLQAGTYNLTVETAQINGGNTATSKIDSPIEVRGVTSATTILKRDQSAATQFRFFFVDTGSLLLEDITLTNGYANGGTGGGAVYVNGTGTFTMSATTLLSNTARTGGAIYNNGQTVIASSSIVGNGATENNQGQGGAIYSTNRLTLVTSNITANTSTQDGGGLYVNGTGSGSLFISLSSITQNVANVDVSGTGAGGGIYHNSGTLSVTLSTLANNAALPSAGGDGNGGGLFVGSDLFMDFTLVSANEANNGAGLYNDGPGNPVISHTLFIANIAVDDGAGIYNQGDLWLDNAILWANIATTGNGGGFFNDTASQTADVRNSTIINNVASAGSGGGWYNQTGVGGWAALNNVTIASNQAGGGDGGGIAISTTGYIVIANTTLYNNTASGNGAGLASAESDPAHVNIRNSILANGTDNCDGSYTSQGYNMQTAADCTLAAMGDKSNATADLGPLSPADPMLVLTGNLTPGYEPQANSDALNAGNPDGCYDALNINNNGMLLAEDQWGQARPLGGASFFCDMGAVENQTVLAIQLAQQGAQSSSSAVWLVGLAAVLLAATALFWPRRAA